MWSVEMLRGRWLDTAYGGPQVLHVQSKVKSGAAVDVISGQNLVINSNCDLCLNSPVSLKGWKKKKNNCTRRKLL
jgi:hypothetical protein